MRQLTDHRIVTFNSISQLCVLIMPQLRPDLRHERADIEILAKEFCANPLVKGAEGTPPAGIHPDSLCQ